ncbi:hypothetical protein [Nocardiopsis sp. MG754419]|uniref:hypothetical protein n=1 Tax=Nocardiopsis sp. MG754419 TaxID=2259865 RepID=UPI001BA946B7|nr:hypothetical protein [Nocardiopsis sp. MG754419]MBR8742233.1 hypothetical protein [Nocardiopsis sp. MG754419]
MNERVSDAAPAQGRAGRTRRDPHRAARRTARGNRQGLALVGTLLMVAGAVPALLTVLPLGPGVEERAGALVTVATGLGSEPWAPYVGAGIAVVIALVALRWLLVQGRSVRVTAVRLTDVGPSADGRGHTDVLARAACSALAREISGYRGVHRGRARLTGSAREPRLALDLVLSRDADPSQVWRRCSDQAITRLRVSLGLARLPTVLRISVSDRPAAREPA